MLSFKISLGIIILGLLVFVSCEEERENEEKKEEEEEKDPWDKSTDKYRHKLGDSKAAGSEEEPVKIDVTEVSESEVHSGRSKVCTYCKPKIGARKAHLLNATKPQKTTGAQQYFDKNELDDETKEQFADATDEKDPAEAKSNDSKTTSKHHHKHRHKKQHRASKKHLNPKIDYYPGNLWEYPYPYQTKLKYGCGANDQECDESLEAQQEAKEQGNLDKVLFAQDAKATPEPQEAKIDKAVPEGQSALPAAIKPGENAGAAEEAKKPAPVPMVEAKVEGKEDKKSKSKGKKEDASVLPKIKGFARKGKGQKVSEIGTSWVTPCFFNANTKRFSCRQLIPSGPPSAEWGGFQPGRAGGGWSTPHWNRKKRKCKVPHKHCRQLIPVHYYGPPSAGWGGYQPGHTGSGWGTPHWNKKCRTPRANCKSLIFYSPHNSITWGATPSAWYRPPAFNPDKSESSSRKWDVPFSLQPGAGTGIPNFGNEGGLSNKDWSGVATMGDVNKLIPFVSSGSMLDLSKEKIPSVQTNIQNICEGDGVKMNFDDPIRKIACGNFDASKLYQDTVGKAGFDPSGYLDISQGHEDQVKVDTSGGKQPLSYINPAVMLNNNSDSKSMVVHVENTVEGAKSHRRRSILSSQWHAKSGVKKNITASVIPSSKDKWKSKEQSSVKDVRQENVPGKKFTIGKNDALSTSDIWNTADRLYKMRDAVPSKSVEDRDTLCRESTEYCSWSNGAPRQNYRERMWSGSSRRHGKSPIHILTHSTYGLEKPRPSTKEFEGVANMEPLVREDSDSQAEPELSSDETQNDGISSLVKDAEKEAEEHAEEHTSFEDESPSAHIDSGEVEHVSPDTAPQQQHFMDTQKSPHTVHLNEVNHLITSEKLPLPHDSFKYANGTELDVGETEGNNAQSAEDNKESDNGDNEQGEEPDNNEKGEDNNEKGESNNDVVNKWIEAYQKSRRKAHKERSKSKARNEGRGNTRNKENSEDDDVLRKLMAVYEKGRKKEKSEEKEESSNEGNENVEDIGGGNKDDVDSYAQGPHVDNDEINHLVAGSLTKEVPEKSSGKGMLNHVIIDTGVGPVSLADHPAWVGDDDTINDETERDVFAKRTGNSTRGGKKGKKGEKVGKANAWNKAKPDSKMILKQLKQIQSESKSSAKRNTLTYPKDSVVTNARKNLPLSTIEMKRYTE